MAIRPRNDPVRLLGRRLLIVVLATLVVAALFGVWGAFKKERESGALRATAERQLSDLSQRQSQLDSNIAKLETARGKEEVLRNQFALAGKGEGVIVIVNATSSEVHATSSAFAEWLHKTFPWW